MEFEQIEIRRCFLKLNKEEIVDCFIGIVNEMALSGKPAAVSHAARAEENEEERTDNERWFRNSVSIL